MSAHQHINQDQLRRLKGLDFGSEEMTIGRARPEDWFDMNHYEALKADIAENGIQRPIKTLYGTYVNEGHHRAMAARDLGLTSIPVIDYDDAEDPETYDTHEESTRWKLYK